MKQEEHALNMEAKHADMQMEREKAAMNAESQRRELAFKQQEHEMTLQQNREKFDQQVAQDSAKAMMDLNNKAREDKEKSDE